MELTPPPLIYFRSTVNLTAYRVGAMRINRSSRRPLKFFLELREIYIVRIAQP